MLRLVKRMIRIVYIFLFLLITYSYSNNIDNDPNSIDSKIGLLGSSINFTIEVYCITITIRTKQDGNLIILYDKHKDVINNYRESMLNVNVTPKDLEKCKLTIEFKLLSFDYAAEYEILSYTIKQIIRLQVYDVKESCMFNSTTNEFKCGVTVQNINEFSRVNIKMQQNVTHNFNQSCKWLTTFPNFNHLSCETYAEPESIQTAKCFVEFENNLLEICKFYIHEGSIIDINSQNFKILTGVVSIVVLIILFVCLCYFIKRKKSKLKETKNKKMLLEEKQNPMPQTIEKNDTSELSDKNEHKDPGPDKIKLPRPPPNRPPSKPPRTPDVYNKKPLWNQGDKKFNNYSAQTSLESSHYVT